MGGDFGWMGIGDRAFEYPAGDDVAVSPSGRLRTRYHRGRGEFQVSIDNGAFTAVQLAAGGGGGSGALSQSDWYVDPVSGDDDNDGATAATALRTWGEYAERVGGNVVVVAQTVNILNDIAEDLRVSATYTQGLTIQGQRTTLLSGTVSGAAAWDGTTSPVTPGTLTDLTLPGDWTDSGPGGSSLVGKMIVMTSGTHVGKTGWILADIGGKTARISQLIDVFTFGTGTPGVGDTFDVVDLTSVTGQLIIGEIGSSFIDAEDLDIDPAGGFIAPFDILGGNFSSGTCKYTGGSFVARVLNATGTLVGSLFVDTTLDISASPDIPIFCCSFIDSRIRVESTGLIMGLVCPCQKAGGALSTANFLVVNTGGRIAIGTVGVVGVVGQTSGTAAAQINPSGQIDVVAGSVFFTVGQTAGEGISIDSYGHAHWPAGSTAGAVYDFDVSGLAVEWSIGGVTTTSAALGGPGSITAANNAGAVPHS